MQVIVTSCKRLKYLKRTIESLRQDDVQLIVVDDGSNDPEIESYIRENADIPVLCTVNKGADFSKNVGLAYVTDDIFMITSDDLVYPKGYSKLLEDQYRKINEIELKYMFMACNMYTVEAKLKHKWVKINNISLFTVCKSQVAGAILNTKIVRNMGGWPIYGTTGAGDRALSHKLRCAGYLVGYFKNPMIEHIGNQKYTDYPEYSKEFRIDQLRVRSDANQNRFNK